MDMLLLLCLISAITAEGNAGEVAGESSLDINIILPDSLADVLESPEIHALQEGDLRTSKLVTSLKAKAKESQRPVMEILRSLGVPDNEISQAWIANEIFVKNVTSALVSSLRNQLPETFVIQTPPRIHSVHFAMTACEDSLEIPRQAAQWGVEKIGAPAAWHVTRGEEVVVASIGTGVYLEHEALSDGFAGSWSDPVYNTPAPTDPNGFDTHILATAVGRTNGVGVAPGAQWIACRAMSAQGSGSMADIISCAQFMLEAVPRPHVILNGWGGTSSSALDSVIKAWKTAGIFAIFPVGGGGPGCGSVGAPSSNPDVIALVSTNTDDTIGSNTGRGPGLQGVVKPDFAGPGVSILSAGTTGPDSYEVLTSSGATAGAHAAGAIALIKSSNTSMSYEEVIELLRLNSVKPPLSDSDKVCSETDWPNMSYGYGRIDVTFLGQ